MRITESRRWGDFWNKRSKKMSVAIFHFCVFMTSSSSQFEMTKLVPNLLFSISTKCRYTCMVSEVVTNAKDIFHILFNTKTELQPQMFPTQSVIAAFSRQQQKKVAPAAQALPPLPAHPGRPPLSRVLPARSLAGPGVAAS